MCFVLGLLLSSPVAAQYKLDTIRYAGNSSNYTDIIYLGDGFTENEMDKFVKEVKKLDAYLFKKEPWNHYSNMFNVFYVKTASNVSGAGMTPETPIDNFYGTTFGCSGVDRMPWPTNMSKVYDVLNKTKPQYDMVIILVNSTKYGGAGNGSMKMMCVSLDESSKETVCHESGHAFADLADEYWYDRDVEHCNDARQINPVKWQRWVGTNQVGVYPFEDTSGWYRPHQNCLMRYLYENYCPVCREAIIERIHEISKSLVSYSPQTRTNKIGAGDSITFELDLLKPSPNTLKIDWKLDGSIVAKNVDKLQLKSDKLSEGTHKLSVVIEDTVLMVRTTDHSKVHYSTVTWKLTNEKTSGISVSQSNDDEFSVGPLPLTDKITFSSKSRVTQTVKMELYDMSGMLVSEGSFAPDVPCSLGTANLEKGIYLLRILIGDRVVYLNKVTK